MYIGGLEEYDRSTGTVRALYSFNGEVIAQRTKPASGASTLHYLHGDHLGSVSLTSDVEGVAAPQQDYTPWGDVRGSDITTTSLDYTGQRRDDTGLLYYHSRFYDPALGRFVSPDTIVPGTASGKGGGAATLGHDPGVALRPLTVDFHESGFVSGLNAENAFTMAEGFWFQLSSDNRHQATYQWGPANPQALNRYAYVLNNPVRYTDPTGHLACILCTSAPYRALFNFFKWLLSGPLNWLGQGAISRMRGEEFENFVRKHFGASKVGKVYHANRTSAAEFDGIYDNVLLEAKSASYWLKEPLGKFTSQVGNQWAIAKSRGVGFAVVSQGPIPQPFKN